MKNKNGNMTIYGLLALVVIGGVIGMFIIDPFSIYLETVYIEGSSIDSLTEANPYIVNLVVDNQRLFLDRAEVSITANFGGDLEPTSTVSTCIIAQNQNDINLWYQSSVSFCRSKGYDQSGFQSDSGPILCQPWSMSGEQIILGQTGLRCWKYVPLPTSSIIELRLYDEVLATFTPETPTVTLALSDIINEVFYDDIISFNKFGVPYEKALELYVSGDANGGRLIFGGISTDTQTELCENERYRLTNPFECGYTINNESCEENATLKENCWDRTQIIVKECVDEEWVDVANTCEKKPFLQKYLIEPLISFFEAMGNFISYIFN